MKNEKKKTGSANKLLFQPKSKRKKAETLAAVIGWAS